MASKTNLFIFGILAVTLGSIIGVSRLPLSFVSAVLALFLIHFRRNLIILWKTFPRDIKGIAILHKTYWKVKECEKKNWTGIDLFREQVKKNPKKICIYFEDQKWSFEDIDHFSNRIANVFLRAGYKKGDVAALLMSNCPEYAAIWLGLGKIGVVTALINNSLRSDPLVHCLKASAAKAVIYGDEYSSAIDDVFERIAHVAKYKYPGTEGPSDALDLRFLMEEASESEPVANETVGYRDRMLYIFTSGTTGMPKPAIFPHNRLLFMSLTVCCVFDLKKDDIVYNPLPLYHTAGGIMGIGGPLCNGYSVVLRKKFSASSYWTDCIKYKCTAAQYIGEMCRYVQMVAPRPEDAQHRVKILFGNGMRPNIMEVFKKRFKVERIHEIYGSTEGNANIVNIDGKVGAVGFLPKILPARMLPLALIKVDEHGEPLRNENGYCIRCKPDEPGMLIGMIVPDDPTREYNGYVGKEHNQKKIVENVFKKGDKAFLSGDILIMDELGYIYFKDRTGDTFRWKGENVSTTEVEDIMAGIIGLKEVTVYGVRVGELEGRAGMAAIVDPKDETDLERLHRELTKKLPAYARPLFIRFTKQVDITGTFKLRKLQLQKEGFNPDAIADKLFFNDGKNYVALTSDLYERLINEKIRV